MAKWDIDRELKRLEPESCPGTTVERALVDVKLITSPDTRVRYGGGKIKLTPQEIERGHLTLWCLSIGLSYQPKAMFYDRTIRGAYLQARKAAKLGKLAAATPWGRQDFTPPKRKAKKLDRRRARSRTGSPATPPG